MKVKVIKDFTSPLKKHKKGEDLDLDLAKLPFVPHLMEKVVNKPKKTVKKTEKKEAE